MKTKTLLSALGAVLLGTIPPQLRVGAADGVVTGGLGGERGGFEDGRGETLSGKYEVPLLEVPAFLDAAAATTTGAKVLLRPANEMEFGRSLGAHYWAPGENGWLATFGADGASDRRALATSIDFTAMPMSDGPALPAVRPVTLADQLTGEAALYEGAEVASGVVDPEAQIGWLGDAGLGTSGGFAGGAFLLLALAALLFSQLAGSRKGRRRHRTASRRRRPSA